MKLIRIEPFANGGHANQTIEQQIPIPKGWAVIPEEMELENFPFGDVTAEEMNGVMTVTGWTPGEMPEEEPNPEPVDEPSVWDEMAVAIEEGVNDV